MDKQKNIPVLRFPEFKGEWEKKKLGNVAEINPKNGDLPKSFIYIDLESVVKGDLLKEEKIEKIDAPSRAQRLLKREDVIFQMVRPYQKNNLFFDKEGDYVASTGYAQIRSSNYSRFIFQYIHFQKFVDNVIEKCTGTSYPSINSSDLANIPIKVPILAEGQKIASFLTAVDYKLLLHKKKKNLLEQYKKGVIRKIFSQELRFKYDNGNEFPKWEQKKLGDIFEEFKESSKINNEFDVLTSSNRGLIPQKDYFGVNRITDRDNLGFNIIPNGFITYRSRSDNGRFTFNLNDLGYTGIISTYYPVFNFINGSNYFMVEYLNFNWEKTGKYSVGTSQLVLALSVLAKIKFLIPLKEEQTKIANFLSSIDEKINLCNTQIEKTEQYKKGLLQKMFV